MHTSQTTCPLEPTKGLLLELLGKRLSVPAPDANLMGTKLGAAVL